MAIIGIACVIGTLVAMVSLCFRRWREQHT